MRVLLVAAVISSDRPAAVLAQVLAPVGKRTIERWRKTEAMSQEPPKGWEEEQQPTARRPVAFGASHLHPDPRLTRGTHMTQTQFATLMAAQRRIAEQVAQIEERLAHCFPTPREMRAQIDAELNAILAPGGGVRVFADD